MHHLFCICDQVPELPPLRTRVEVLMHRREWSKTTATAHLARLVLGEAGCRIHLRGYQEHPLTAEQVLDPDRRPLLLFPAPDARELTPELLAEDPNRHASGGLGPAEGSPKGDTSNSHRMIGHPDGGRRSDASITPDPRAVSLVVPDGSWRQASKVPKRVEWLQGVQRVVLPDLKTRYRLREENRDGGLATYEAIAYALGVLEGEAVAAAMLRLFDAMVEGTLATRQGLG